MTDGGKPGLGERAPPALGDNAASRIPIPRHLIFSAVPLGLTLSSACFVVLVRALATSVGGRGGAPNLKNGF